MTNTIRVRRIADGIECTINEADFAADRHEEIKAAPPAGATAPKKREVPERGDDDLTRIVGVGPKIAKNLYEAGVRSFMGVSDMSDESLKAAGVYDPETARDSALELMLEEE